jgi:Autism susceptibility gene 2 protein
MWCSSVVAFNDRNVITIKKFLLIFSENQLVCHTLNMSLLQKTGKWNAMHVRIAWEIHYKQQDKAAEAKAAAIASGKPPTGDLLRPPTGPHHLFSGPMPPPTPNPSATAFSALQHQAPPHHRPAPFVEPPPPSFMSPHLSPFARFPGFAPPGAQHFAGMGPMPGVFAGREMSSMGPLSAQVHDQWNR